MRGAQNSIRTDQNVFDITQGVIVGIFEIQPIESNIDKCINYTGIIGSRQEKYKLLTNSTLTTIEWSKINPIADKWLFVPFSSNSDYESWPKFLDIIGTGNSKHDRDTNYGTGIKTRHDPFVIGWTVLDAVRRVMQIAHRSENDATLMKELELCTTVHFSIAAARRRAESGDLSSSVKQIVYRPFDCRSIVYLREFVCEPKIETMRPMSYSANVAMAVLRRNRKENGSGFFIARGLIAKDLVSNLDDALVWPLYRSRAKDLYYNQASNSEYEANIAESTIKHFVESLRLGWLEFASGNLDNTFGPQDIFNYIYSILYSPNYRISYAKFLIFDFPHIPLTNSLDLFRSLATLGGELVALHLLEAPLLTGIDAQYASNGWHYTYGQASPLQLTFTGSQQPLVEKQIWSSDTVWLDKAQSVGFYGVPEAVWNFHIGGYQVCDKWLKDRKGRTLSAEDITHYHRIVVALHETIRLMGEIDAVIEEHGGWPLQ